jgi:hypothetical protein
VTLLTRLSEETRVGLAEDILFSVLGEEAVLLSLSHGQYFGLDTVGTRFVQLIIEYGRLGAVVQALVQEYEAPRERIWDDLVRLVAELGDQGLVVVQDE